MKREQMGSVHDADIWQPFRAAIVPVQQAVQLGFQVPWPPLTHAGKPRPAGSDSRKRRLCCCNVWTAWGNGATAGEAIWITAPDRVLQAALMKRLHKPVETASAVMHQKPGVLFAQNRGRLGIPTVRLNHVNCDLTWFKSALPCQFFHAAPEPTAASEVFKGRFSRPAQIRQAPSRTHSTSAA